MNTLTLVQAGEADVLGKDSVHSDSALNQNLPAYLNNIKDRKWDTPLHPWL